jgi:tetratricopeptide (TPR) repeat protein
MRLHPVTGLFALSVFSALTLGCSEPTPHERAARAAQRAGERYLAGDFAAAESESRAALQLNPDHAEARYVLGRALFKTGRVRDALTEYERAIALAPDRATFHLSLAEALVQDDRDAAAAAALTRALEIEPGNAEAKEGLALVNARLDASRKEAAALVAAADRACGLDRKPTAGVLVVGLDCSCDLPKAAAAYARAATLDIASANAHGRLALLLSHMGDHKRAAEEYQRAAQLAPQHRGYAVDAATALELSGDREAAERTLLVAATAQPDNVTVRIRLAELARRAGNEGRALVYYQQGANIPVAGGAFSFATAEKLHAEFQVYRITHLREPEPAPKVSAPACVTVTRRETAID